MHILFCGFNVVFAPCKNSHACENGKACTHKFRITSFAKVNSPQLLIKAPSASLPDLHEEINPSPRLSLQLNYSLAKSPSHLKATNQTSFTVSSGEDGMIYRWNHCRRYLFSFYARNSNTRLDLATLSSPHRQIGGNSQSLPDLYSSDITHRSTTVLETFKISPNLFQSKESYLDPNTAFGRFECENYARFSRFVLLF